MFKRGRWYVLVGAGVLALIVIVVILNLRTRVDSETSPIAANPTVGATTAPEVSGDFLISTDSPDIMTLDAILGPTRAAERRAGRIAEQETQIAQYIQQTQDAIGTGTRVAVFALQTDAAAGTQTQAAVLAEQTAAAAATMTQSWEFAAQTQPALRETPSATMTSTEAARATSAPTSPALAEYTRQIQVSLSALPFGSNVRGVRVERNAGAGENVVVVDYNVPEWTTENVQSALIDTFSAVGALIRQENLDIGRVRLSLTSPAFEGVVTRSAAAPDVMALLDGQISVDTFLNLLQD